MLKSASSLVLILAVIIALVQVGSTDFTYRGQHGPTHWAEEYKKCNGKHQSPININLMNVVNKTLWPIDMVGFNLKPLSAVVLNNGHTVIVRLNFTEGATPTISDGPLQEHGVYQFTQFHFHWGGNDSIGSEDLINNVSYAAELHMVFRNSKYKTIEEASVAPHGVAVMAFFFEVQGPDNRNYEEFTGLLSEVSESGVSAAFQNPPTLNQLITSDVVNYYTYIGSLTTPPCSEDVTWIDFAEPIQISEKQIERFRKLYTMDGSHLANNFRPIQPLNNRTIYRAVTTIATEPPRVEPKVTSFGIILKSSYVILGILSAVSFPLNHSIL